MVAVSDPANPVAREQAMDHLRSMARQRNRAFARAPFTVFGLDSSWTGLRSFGGWGSSNGVTTNLSLAYGDITTPGTPLIRVETRAPHPIGLGHDTDPVVDRYLAASDLASHLARTTGPLTPDVREAAFPYQDPDAFGKDPTAPWDDAMIPVDAVPVPAKVLSADASWVALVQVDELFVGITATGWTLGKTGLVAVTDFAVYADGSAELAERMRRRHSPPPTTP